MFKFAVASRALSIVLLLVIHATHISARKPSGTTNPISLHLDSIESATFAFYVFFTLLTLLQALRAVGALRKRSAEDNFPRRVPFILLIFLSILSLLATHSLDAILESQINGITLTSFNFAVFNAMSRFVHALTYIFLYAALLLLLDYRNGHSKSMSFVIVFRVVSAALLSIMLLSAVARAIVGSTQSMSYSYDQQPPLAEQALYHLFLACDFLLTMVICGLCIVLWMTKHLVDSQNDWLPFDTSVSISSLPISLSLSNLVPGPLLPCALPPYYHPCCLCPHSRHHYLRTPVLFGG